MLTSTTNKQTDHVPSDIRTSFHLYFILPQNSNLNAIMRKHAKKTPKLKGYKINILHSSKCQCQERQRKAEKASYIKETKKIQYLTQDSGLHSELERSNTMEDNVMKDSELILH